MRKMITTKKIVILLELVLACFLCGCTQVAGLDEQLIVYGIGVDKTEDAYELTVQALNTQTTSESNSEEEGKSIINISAAAPTLIEAVNKIENQTGKKILYSHAIVLIIGQETAKSGIKEIIKFFSTNHKLRPTVEVLISSAAAKDVFANEGDGDIVNAEDIVSISKIGKESDDGINSNIRYLLSDLENPQKAAKVWLLEYNKDEGKVACPQIALFKSDKLTDVLSEEATKGVLLLYKKAKNIADSINVGDAQLYYELSKAKSKTSVSVDGSKPVFNVSLCADLELYNADNLAANSEIKPIIESRLAELMQKAIDSCIKKNSCDIFNFYRHIMNANAGFFKENLANLEEVLKAADYEISAQAKIRYMGANQKISSLVY